MKRLSMALGTLAIAACGGAGMMAPTSSQLAAYQQAALTATDATAAYRTAATTATTPADCAAASQQYLSHMQQAIDQMKANAAAMDQGMMSGGQGTSADLQCGVDEMARQLAQYQAIACTSPDVAQNQAQAALHCDVMRGYADHMQMRGAEMDEMQARMHADGGGMMGGGSGSMMTGSWQGPNGQTMGWDHHIAGCTATPTSPALAN
jgi:hypothetical protein